MVAVHRKCTRALNLRLENVWQSLGLALLLGGTATGFALQLRRTKELVHCEAALSGSEPATGEVEQRVMYIHIYILHIYYIQYTTHTHTHTHTQTHTHL
jgi:hypothetical protein